MPQSIPGVQISVFANNDKPLAVASDGFISCSDEAGLLLQVSLDPNRHLFAFTVDGTKNVIPKKQEEGLPNQTNQRLYQLRVSVAKNERGQPYTRYPDNNLRLVEQLGRDTTCRFDADGRVRIWEIAIVAQRGSLFLTLQPTYEVECYRDKRGACFYPFFSHWPQLNKYLVSLLPASVMPAPVDTYTPELLPNLNGLGDNEGLVAWFNEAQGLGCLQTKKGNARVHWSQILARRPHHRRAFLQAGEKIYFDRLQPPQKISARPTAFKLEAIGVRLA